MKKVSTSVVGGSPSLKAINNTCQKLNLVPKEPLALMPNYNDDNGHFCSFFEGSQISINAAFFYNQSWKSWNDHCHPCR